MSLEIWRDLSITKKLYLVVGVMAFLIASELALLRISLRSLSAARAFVEGESHWSKAQKEAASYLKDFKITSEEKYFRKFLESFSVSDGDHLARTELESPHPDLTVVYNGFLAGGLHPDDIPAMIELLQRFYWIDYIAEAVAAWTRADILLAEFKRLGLNYHDLIQRGQGSSQEASEISEKINVLDEQLTEAELIFSKALGEGSRWVERVVILILFIVVFFVEGIGLMLTVLTCRSISRGLASLNDAAKKITHGDLSVHLKIESHDEIGHLMDSVNQMGRTLKASYDDLELRVAERTAKLSALATENAHLYEETKAAVRSRDEFISVASHELKTPLTSLTLQLQLLSRTLEKHASQLPVGEKLLAFARSALASAHRQTSLIEKLLDLARARAGKLVLTKEDCDLVQIAKDCISQISANREMKISLQTVEIIKGQFDPTRINQVITNLVTNAAKYGGGSPIQIRLSATQHLATLSVQDFGPGIPASEQSRIFERFEQGETQQKPAGLGLGLYIARQIIEGHQGTLSVKSELGRGSEFIVELPI